LFADRNTGWSAIIDGKILTSGRLVDQLIMKSTVFSGGLTLQLTAVFVAPRGVADLPPHYLARPGIVKCTNF